MTATNPPAPPLALPAPPAVPLLAGPEPSPPTPATESGWTRRAGPIAALVLAAFVVVAFSLGWFFHHRRSAAAEAANDQQREQMPMADVVAARRSPALSELLLPGSLSPLTEAALYARAADYVRHRFVDIGDNVRMGQVLAEIESPELDQQVAQGLATTAQARQQLNQVRASVGDAHARLDLARVAWQRWDGLQQVSAVSKQDADQKRQEYESAQSALAQTEANVGAAAESVRAAEANQRRLAALQGFERLRAPFDGVVTARSFDEGALIGSNGAGLSDGGSAATATPAGSTSGTGSPAGSDSSGSGGSTSAGPPLFRVARIDRLRVYVAVPQDNATSIQVGSDATVLIQAFERPIAGRVTRTARSLDPDSRTLLTEVQIDNHAHMLIPGMYAQVRFASARSNPPLLVPGEALIVRGSGLQVATLAPLDEDARSHLAASPDARCARQVRLRQVSIGRDYGTQVEVTKGLIGGEFIVANPGDSVRDNAVLLPHLQAEEMGGSDAKAGAGSGGEKTKGPDSQQQARQLSEQTCVEQQARQQADRAARSGEPVHGSEAGGGSPSGLAPGGESERAPAGIQSPSMAAPTQGQKR